MSSTPKTHFPFSSWVGLGWVGLGWVVGWVWIVGACGRRGERKVCSFEPRRTAGQSTNNIFASWYDAESCVRHGGARFAGERHSCRLRVPKNNDEHDNIMCITQLAKISIDRTSSNSQLTCLGVFFQNFISNIGKNASPVANSCSEERRNNTNPSYPRSRYHFNNAKNKKHVPPAAHLWYREHASFDLESLPSSCSARANRWFRSDKHRSKDEATADRSQRKRNTRNQKRKEFFFFSEYCVITQRYKIK